METAEKLRTKKNNTLQTVFELIEIHYESYDENGEFITPKYPEFKVYESRYGLYSTLAKAEQAMKEWADSHCEVIDETFGFHITELYIDSMFDIKTIRNYLSDGSLLDECLLEEFFGRPADKVRYRNGDLVEILSGETVSLGIVGNPPNTPEENQKCKERLQASGFDLDDFLADDFYYILHFSEEEYHPDGYCYSHSSSTSLFPVRFPVSDEIKNNLEKHYRNYRSYIEKH